LSKVFVAYILHYKSTVLRPMFGDFMARVRLQAMVKDSKLNSMLLPASKLKKLLAAHALHGSRGRCGFRVPNKRLW